MSFRKVTRSVHGPGKRPARLRKPPRSKQDWVSTVQDLTVHQATPEELSRRHELYRSRHQASAQRELRQRVLQSSGPGRARTSTPEASSDQYRLCDVLARSDHVMAMVKDLFRDAPHRQTGFPSVTLALDSKPVLEPVLLLDPSGAGGSGPEPSLHDVAVSRCPVQDQCHSRPLSPDAPGEFLSCPQGPQCVLNATPVVRQLLPQVPLHMTDPPASRVSHILNLEPISPKPVKRTSRGQYADFSRLSSSDLCSSSGGCSSLEVLQARLRKMELQLDSLGPAAAPRGSGDQQGDASLSGFSTALVAILDRLVQHLCKSHEKVQKEVTVRRRRSLEEQLGEQQQLIDALTAESLLLHRDTAALQKHVKDLDKRLNALVLALRELGGLGPEAEPRTIGRVPVARGELLQYQVTSSEERQEAVEYDESTASSCSFMSLPYHGSAHNPATKLDPVPLQPGWPSQQTQMITGLSVASGTAQKGALSVEQRLLELNRRSMEAQSRLLSLIEEQRQAIGGGVSTCISPILSRSSGASTLLPVCEPEP